MGSTSRVTGRAAVRAAERRARYRAAGLWVTEPVDLVGDAAAEHGDRPALTTRDESLSYSALDRAVNAGVGWLRGIGVEPGDPVLLLVGNDVESVLAVHAVVRLGATAMVALTSAGAAHVSDIVEQTQPRLALAPSEWIAATPEAGAGATTWHAIEGVRSGSPVADAASLRRDPDDPVIVIFTSGTTSRPKGVVHSLNTLLVAGRNYVDAAGLGADDRLFVISPLASVTGVLQFAFVAPLIGAQTVIEHRFDTTATFDFLMAVQGTFFGGPDLLLDRVLGEAAVRGIGHVPIELVYLGGSMLDRRILDRAEHEYDIVVLRAYGSSEAPISTAGRRDEPEEVRLADDGAALDGVELRIGSVRDPGECCIGGAHLFLGYVDEHDDETAFDDGWFLTGDVAELHDGRLKVVGRIKDIVIRNGLKIPLSEVEGMIARLPGVEQCAAFGVADEATGERVAVAVRAVPGLRVEFDDIVTGLTAAGLAKWKLPEEVIAWDGAFPETASGKVQRNRLEALSAGRDREVAPRLR